MPQGQSTSTWDRQRAYQRDRRVARKEKHRAQGEVGFVPGLREPGEVVRLRAPVPVRPVLGQVVRGAGAPGPHQEPAGLLHGRGGGGQTDCGVREDVLAAIACRDCGKKLRPIQRTRGLCSYHLAVDGWTRVHVTERAQRLAQKADRHAVAMRPILARRRRARHLDRIDRLTVYFKKLLRFVVEDLHPNSSGRTLARIIHRHARQRAIALLRERQTIRRLIEEQALDERRGFTTGDPHYARVNEDGDGLTHREWAAENLAFRLWVEGQRDPINAEASEDDDGYGDLGWDVETRRSERKASWSQPLHEDGRPCRTVVRVPTEWMRGETRMIEGTLFVVGAENRERAERHHGRTAVAAHA